MTQLIKDYLELFKFRNNNIQKLLNIAPPFILEVDQEWLKITTPYNHSVMRIKEGESGNIIIKRLNKTYDYKCDDFNHLYSTVCHELLKRGGSSNSHFLANDLQVMSDNDTDFENGLFATYVNGTSIILVSNINNCALSLEQAVNGLDWKYILNGNHKEILGLNNIEKLYASLKDIVVKYTIS